MCFVGNKLQEVEFVAELRELELEILTKQETLEELGANKYRLQNELIETEKLILLWERKTQLARETIAAVDTEVDTSNITRVVGRFLKQYISILR